MLDILGYNKNVYLSLCWWVQTLILGHFLDIIVGKHGNFVQKTSIKFECNKGSFLKTYVNGGDTIPFDNF